MYHTLVRAISELVVLELGVIQAQGRALEGVKQIVNLFKGDRSGFLWFCHD
jgi:hypothetical protein